MVTITVRHVVHTVTGGTVLQCAVSYRLHTYSQSWDSINIQLYINYKHICVFIDVYINTLILMFLSAVSIQFGVFDYIKW